MTNYIIKSTSPHMMLKGRRLDVVLTSCTCGLDRTYNFSVI